MTEELMVGTYGWDYPAWVGPYYPDDLPDDWRFGYYSNDFRSVLLPNDHFTSNTTDVSEWAEDCDESFRFVVQVDVGVLAGPGSGLVEFLQSLLPLEKRVVGYFVDLAESTDSPEAIVPALDSLANHGPLCLKPPKQDDPAEIAELAKRLNAGICWTPESMTAPMSGGTLMVALTKSNDQKFLRQMIESLELWMQQSGGIAGLFITGGVDVTRAASQARVIAEMLGI